MKDKLNKKDIQGKLDVKIKVKNIWVCGWCNNSCPTCASGDNCWYCEDREFGSKWL